MKKELTLDGDTYRCSAYSHFKYNTGRLQEIVQEIYLHTMIKGHLLAGRSQSWIARHAGISKKTIAQVIGMPLLALEELHYKYPLDSHMLLDSIFDKSHSSIITPRGAITACMAYDLEHISTGEDIATLQVRYNTSAFDMLKHAQQVHGHVAVHRIYNHDPGRSAEVVDYCARALGCDEEWIAQARSSVEEWLTTPIVPEVCDRVYQSWHAVSAPRQQLDEILSAQRREREDREYSLYGRPRPRVDDTDESPAAVGRDLLLVSEGFNTQPELIDYRDNQSRGTLIRDFSREIGLDSRGLDDRFHVIADTPQGWVDAVDQALYDTHQVHLPHVNLADDPGPWPHSPADLVEAKLRG